MDRFSFIGFFFVLVLLVGGSIFKGVGLVLLWLFVVFVIVIVGIVVVILLYILLVVFKYVFKIVCWVVCFLYSDCCELIQQIVEWSNIVCCQGLLGLELQVEVQQDLFLCKGLQLLVDGVEFELMWYMLEIELGSQEYQDQVGVKVFEVMGIYVFIFGIIGVVFGLIVVMKNLVDLSKFGYGIVVVFIVMIYGIVLVNLLFLLIVVKFKSVILYNMCDCEMVIEGLILIVQGENLCNIEINFFGFLY